MKTKLWCCYDEMNNPYLHSAQHTKQKSILALKLLHNIEDDWNLLKKKGWKCIKVEVTINEVK